MRNDDYPKLFTHLLTSFETVRIHRGDGQNWYDEEKANEWIAEAGAAIASVFLPSHPTRQSWEAIVQKLPFGACPLCTALIGVFKGAANQVQGGRIGSLVESIRVESESELLDQAEQLLAGGYLAAAAVIAGGALESHLHNYCAKHNIIINGTGSISAYNGAVGKARKTMPNLYDANEGKNVEAWGGIRNDAAHTPGTFKYTKDQVKRLVDGIRDFIGRI